MVNYIRKHLDDAADDPLRYFYLLIKLHKTPMSGKPVSSNCGSLPHAFGQWIDKTLQPIVQDQALYFTSSAELKSEMEQLDLPINTILKLLGVPTPRNPHYQALAISLVWPAPLSYPLTKYLASQEYNKDMSLATTIQE